MLPEISGVAPGISGFAPGVSGFAPGVSGSTPGVSGTLRDFVEVLFFNLRNAIFGANFTSRGRTKKTAKTNLLEHNFN